MRIDIHCHTKKSKIGDPATRSTTKELFKAKVMEAGVNLLCITNHNEFDLEQYIEYREEVKDFCDVWPGIELDVLLINDKIGHALIVCDPDNAQLLSDHIAKLVNGDCENFKANTDQLAQLSNELSSLVIVHYYKSRNFTDDDVEELGKKMDNPTRLLKEPAQFSSLGILHYKNERAIIGSDVKDWNDYEKCNFGDMKFKVKGFKNFVKLVEKEITFIESLVNRVESETITVYGRASDSTHPFEIPIFNDINIIFGDKGSGKSEILESLKNYYASNGKGYVHFKGGDKDKWYKELLGVVKESYIAHDYFGKNSSEIFGLIDSFKEENAIGIKPFVKYRKQQVTNENLQKFKAKDLTFPDSISSEKLEKHKNEYDQTLEFMKDFKSFEIASQDFEKSKQLDALLKNILDMASELIKEDWLDFQASKLCYHFTREMRDLAASQTGTVPAPTSTGLLTFVRNRINLKREIELFNSYLCSPNKEVSKYIGDISDKGKGMIHEEIRFVNLESVNKTEAKNIINCNKRSIIAFLENIEEVKASLYSNDLLAKLEVLRQVKQESGICDFEKFLVVKKEFRLANTNYVPSSGEKAILALQHELISNIESKDIFLIDEPELNLGGVYIEQNIVPLLKRLALFSKTIVIATHDANIAVRTRPVNSIMKITNNNSYQTYIGNMFTDKMVNINDINDVKSWREYSAKFLEGGLDAFDERGYLYAK